MTEDAGNDKIWVHELCIQLERKQAPFNVMIGGQNMKPNDAASPTVTVHPEIAATRP